MRRVALLIPVLAVVAACQQATVATAESVQLAPSAQREAHEADRLQTAIFSGGCFWGIEGVFSHIVGVTSAVSGYQGGAKDTASYDRVSQGDTGHAESVRVTYDPKRIRYDQLLRIFFSVATDPTQLNQQGPDIGTQYRSALVPTSEEQRAVATAYLAQMGASGFWRAPIVTRIEPNRGFFPAESQHQDFMFLNPDYPYIVQWDAPKVDALRRLFPAQYKSAFTRN